MNTQGGCFVAMIHPKGDPSRPYFDLPTTKILEGSITRQAIYEVCTARITEDSWITYDHRRASGSGA